MIKNIKKIKYILMTLIICFTLVSCNSSNTSKQSSSKKEEDNILLEVFESLEIEIDTLEVEGIEISEIEEGIERLYPEKIQFVEMTVIPINDQVISLVRAELVQHYGVDLDIDKLLKDILVASAVFIIDVVVTAASIIAAPATGGTSTAFGVTILSSITKVASTVLDVSTKASAIISAIGVAIDGAIEGVKAYNEGGDISYILGHVLNGVVDGIKWGMLFYPFSFAIEGVLSTIAQKRLLSKATQYIDDITKSLPNIEERAAKEIFENSMKNADEILDIVNKAAKNETISSDIYDSLAKLVGESFDNTTDIGKVIFDMFSQNKIDLYKLLRSFNPYDNLAKVTKKMQEGFLGISGETFETLRTAMVKKTIESLDDKLIMPFKEIILNNLDDFQTLFGHFISDKLKIDILSEFALKLNNKINKETVAKNIEILFTQLIKDGNLVEALKKISVNSSKGIQSINIIKTMINDSGVYNIFASSMSAKKMTTFIAQMNLFENLNIYSSISDKELVTLLENTINGTYKNLTDVFEQLGRVNDLGEITAIKSKILSIDYVAFKDSLDVLGNTSNYEELLKSIAAADLKYNYKISDDAINLILSSKNYDDEVMDILTKYCLDSDSYILKYVDDYSSSINLKNIINKSFKDMDLSDEIIEKIRRGTSILEVFDEDEYYKAIKLYNVLENVNGSLGNEFKTNFINDFDELVEKYFKKVVYDNHTVRNKIASQLLMDLGYDSTDVVLKKMIAYSESALNKQSCQEVINICDFAKTLGTNRSSLDMVDASQLAIIIDNLFEGSINSCDDILSLLNKESSSIVSRNFTYGEALISDINKLNIPNSDNLIKNIQILSISSKLNNTVDGYKMADVVADIINNKLGYEEIVSKYSYKVYYNFVEHGNLIISKLVVSQDDELAELITKLSIDTINKAINDGTTKITSEMLQSIVSGTPLNQIKGLTDIMIVDNYSYLFNYAKSIKSNDLLNQIVEARTRFFSSLNISENTLTQAYAGGTFTTILGNAVDVTINGHVVLDNYAIAAVTLDLTGDSSKDIAKANMLFFGTSKGPKGYTWHHLEDGRTMILVPTSVHENVGHTGGAHYLRNYYDVLFQSER